MHSMWHTCVHNYIYLRQMCEIHSRIYADETPEFLEYLHEHICNGIYFWVIVHESMLAVTRLSLAKCIDRANKLASKTGVPFLTLFVRSFCCVK